MTREVEVVLCSPMQSGLHDVDEVVVLADGAWSALVGGGGGSFALKSLSRMFGSCFYKLTEEREGKPSPTK